MGCSLLASTVIQAAAPADDDPEAPASGLVASFRPAATDRAIATRIDPDLSWHWGHAAADTRIPSDSFVARLSGSILIQAPGANRFHARTDTVREHIRPLPEGWERSVHATDIPAGPFQPLLAEYPPPAAVATDDPFTLRWATANARVSLHLDGSKSSHLAVPGDPGARLVPMTPVDGGGFTARVRLAVGSRPTARP